VVVLVRPVILAVIGSLVVAALLAAARRANAAERTRTLGARPRWRLPARIRTPLTRALTDADIELEPEHAVELWLGAATVATAFAVALAAPLALPVALTAAVAGPTCLYLARGRRRSREAAAVPGALEQVAAELRAGATVRDGLGTLADGTGPLAGDLRRVRVRAALGVGLDEALRTWTGESPLPEVRAAAGALAVAATIGGRAADALDGLAVSLRDRHGAQAEARSLSAQSRLSALVVGAAPVAYLTFSAVIDPAGLRPLLGTTAGRLCLAVGLACEMLAALWMRRILRVDP
jgi:tight adherence protein B